MNTVNAAIDYGIKNIGARANREHAARLAAMSPRRRALHRAGAVAFDVAILAAGYGMAGFTLWSLFNG